MSVIAAAQNSVGVSALNTTEVAVITVGPVVIPRESISLLVIWTVDWTIGTTESGHAIRVRRGPLGTVADPQIGPTVSVTVPTGGSGAVQHDCGFVIDGALSLGPTFYTLTLVHLAMADTRSTVSQGLAVLALL